MNVWDCLEIYSSETALITEDSRQISYQALLRDADRIADSIDERCLVFIVCRNTVESLAGYIGLMRANIVPALMSDLVHQTLFDALLKHYQPKYIFLPRQAKQKVQGTEVFCCGDYTLLKTKFPADYTLHQDLAVLLTTSGSTGSPKFVRQTYKNIQSNAEAITQYLSITGSDRAITTMPMSYSYGLSILHTHLSKGATIVLSEATLMDKRFWNSIK